MLRQETGDRRGWDVSGDDGAAIEGVPAENGSFCWLKPQNGNYFPAGDTPAIRCAAGSGPFSSTDAGNHFHSSGYLSLSCERQLPRLPRPRPRGFHIVQPLVGGPSA